ncbi:sigma factor [Dyella telluris]|uniref:Uncharacterized protein n=1 Tax=Dyella telluris TaxID=2763498 RepID=A0A7G8Q4R2_9GAMM|nr:sigma factor [Dyella telluris]QNK01770.1 hypothetical protein H8F01_00890 [Dyella telluris]
MTEQTNVQATSEVWVRKTHHSEKRTVEQYYPLINKLANKFMVRVMATGAPYDLDDIEQELALTFVRCDQSYDDEKGASFINFFIQASWKNLQRLVTRDEQAVLHGSVLHPDQRADDEEGESLWAVIASDELTPEELVTYADSTDKLVKALSADARQLLECVINPPEVVLNQFDKYQRGAQLRRNAGYATRARKELTLSFVASLMEIHPSVARRSRHEIERKAQLFLG